MAIFGRNPELEAKVILDLRETLKNIRDATEGAKTFDEQVAALKKAIVEFSRVSNQSFEKTASQMKKLGEDLFAGRTELPITQALRQLQKEAQDPTGLERFRRILERVEESQQRLIQISQELANAFRTSFNVAIASGTNLRQRVDALKEEMRAFQQVTGESLQFTSQAFRDTAKSTEAFTVADVNQAFRELREEAREAEQQLKATFIGAQPPTQVLRTNVDAVKQAILALKDSSGESLQFATTAFRQLNAQTGQFDAATIAQAFRELQGEAKTLDEQLRKTFIESPVQYTTNFRTNVDLIKQQIETLRQSGITSIGDLEQGFRRFAQITQAFSLSEVTQAFKEVREALKLEDSQRGLKDAGQEADRFRQNVNQIKAEMIALGEGGRRSLKDVEEGFRRANETSQRFNPREITQAVREIGEQAKNTTGAFSGLAGAFSNLGDVGRFVFGSVLGITAVTVLRNLIDLFGELIQRGLDFAQTQFNIGVSIRALQRVGVEVTFADLGRQVDELSQKFGIFSRKELVEGIFQIQSLTRNVQLTEEELERLGDATAKVAILTGRDFGETANAVARAIASGYTEALQRAGIAASRLAIQQEAMRQGINKTFLAMTEQERASVTLSLVYKQLEATGVDIEEFQESLAGRLATATAEIENQLDVIGRRFSPILVTATELFSKLLSRLVIGIETVINAWAILLGTLVGGVSIIKSVFSGVALSIEEQQQIVADSIGQMLDSFQELFGFKFDITEGTDVLDQLGINELPGELDETVEESQNLLDKLTDIFRKFYFDLENLSIDFARKLEDLETKRLQRIADENLDFQQDIEKINRQFADRQQDAEEKFREQELKAEEDFQEKLLRLREKFLFNLEDALRERDARQVLRLIRRFNLEQDQLERERNQEEEQRERRHEQEIQDIEQQKQRRLRELRIEHEQRLTEIEVQNQREREQAQLNHERRIADLIRQRDERLSILRSELDAELQMLFDFAVAQFKLLQDIAAARAVILSHIQATAGALDAAARPPVRHPHHRGTSIPDELEGGPGTGTQSGFGTFVPGEDDESFEDKLQDAVERALKEAIKNAKGGGFQEGGTLVARRPRLALFGERGPEIVRFSPLNRVGADEGRIFGDSIPVGPNGRQGRLELLIGLSKDLEHRIITEAVNETADIILERIS